MTHPFLNPSAAAEAPPGWHEADRAHLIHPQHHPVDHAAPVLWSRGEGAFLIDAEGRRLIDGLSGMWNVHLGHARPELIAAATTQLQQLAFANTYAGASHGPGVALAEKLSEIAPEGIEAFFFTTSGSEATETSVRTARWFWQSVGQPRKTKIISRDYSYHGSTGVAASVTGVTEFSQGFGPPAPDILHIPSPYPYRFEGTGQEAADLLEQAILREGPETVAAFIAEPVQGGGGGVIVPQDDYFPRIREICDRYDVLFIADEVITGFGRTGHWFAVAHWGVRPDIVQFAKGITSGYIPLGGIGVSGRIKAALDAAPPAKRWWHGFTASAHPVACAVALETIRILEAEGLAERAARKGKHLLGRLHAGLADHPNVGDIRGLGLLFGIELVADRTTKRRFGPETDLAPRLRRELFARGLSTRVLTDVICLAPPLTTPDAELEAIADIVTGAIHAVLPPVLSANTQRKNP